MSDKRRESTDVRSARPWGPVLVHIFTALGALAALLAMQAVISRSWEQAFAWLGLAFFIDALDGPFARRTDVAGRLPRFSGERLDLVIDYLTYVFIPALMLLQAGYLSGPAGLALAGLIVMSSLYHFSDLGSKCDDHCFVGFPAIWNAVAFYIFAFDIGTLWVWLIVTVFVALTFVPLKWIHPLRVRSMRAITVTLTLLWSIAAGWTVWSGFPAAPWLKWVLALTVVYGAGLSLTKGLART